MAEKRIPETEAEARLRNALNARVRRSGRSVRSLELEIGLGHGTLGNMLRGRSELRFHHLERLGRALGCTVPELVAEAYELVPPQPRGRHDRLRALVEDVVRAELAAFWDRHGIRLEGRRARARVQEIES